MSDKTTDTPPEGKAAPDAKAQALAARLSGGVSPERQVQDMLTGQIDTMLDNVEDPAPKRRAKRPTEEVDDEPNDLDDTSSESDEEDEEDQDDDPDDDDPDDDPGEEAEEDADEDDEEHYDEVAYDDDDLVDVTVDGEVVEVSLRDLKKAYSGEGAISKRLKDATEARKEAEATREAARAEVETHRVNMLRTIQALDSSLFQPLVDKPDPALRTKNMNEYLLAKDAYDEDQERIKVQRASLTDFLAGQGKQLAEEKKSYRQKQAQLLQERLPVFKDPVKGPKAYGMIMDTAKAHGLTEEFVKSLDHHAFFTIAYDAARWRNLQELKKTSDPSKGDSKMVRKRRKLRSGSATARAVSTNRSSKEARAATAKASASGRVEDVAAMIASKAKPKGKPNGRSRQNV